MREDSEKLMSERMKLTQEQEQFRLDCELLEKEKEKLETYCSQIQQRSIEIEQISEVPFYHVL